MSGTSNMTISAKESLHNESEMAFSRMHQFSGISKHSTVTGTPQAIREWLMLSRAGSHARTSAMQEKERESKEREADSGKKCFLQFAQFDQDTSLWKTAQLSFLEDSEQSLGIWPRSGMTQGGIAYLRESAVHVTSATGLGLLPTPTAIQSRNRTSGRKNPDSEHHDGITLWDWIWLEIGRERPKPSFVEWMMLWPIGWSGLEPLETDKFQQWLKQHGKF